MASTLNPYIGFNDDARQAMEFYQAVFGGTLDISTFAEYHASEDPAEGDKIMRAQLKGANGIVFMGADTPNGMEFNPASRISMSLSGGSEDESELRGYWDKLSDGGIVIMPLEKAPWGDTFGMVSDKFGIKWMVNIAGSGAAPSETSESSPEEVVENKADLQSDQA